ncbi:MAG TPA: acyl-CoA dehydrogenase family protein [Candidatus Binataceae bacterium]|nr:acyl-CoA dehydrogenase family protein [Candidatus Binataceae bacterium]
MKDFPSNSRSELVSQARDLRSLLSANAIAVERERRLVPENVEALERLGLFKVMVPERWGGHGASLTTVLEIAAELAKGCTATAWVQVIIGGSSWIASLLPDRGQEEIFSAGAPRVCGVIMPTAKTRRVDDGYIVSGQWSFASGCLHAQWAALGIPLVNRAGEIVGEGLAFVPLAELRIDDTWFMAGMRGTGSNTLVGEELFIPNHRVLSLADCVAGRFPASRHKGADSDHWAFVPALALSLTGVVMGAAQAALDLVIEGAAKRGISYTYYEKQTDSQIVHGQVAEAAMKIQGAWLYARRAAQEIDGDAHARRAMNYAQRARIRGECGWIGKLVREAVDLLASVAGSASFADTNAMQRLWRDINVATRHPHLASAHNLELYGRVLLDVPGNITPGI